MIERTLPDSELPLEEPENAAFELYHIAQRHVIRIVQTTAESADRCNESYRANHCENLFWRKSYSAAPRMKNYKINTESVFSERKF